MRQGPQANHTANCDGRRPRALLQLVSARLPVHSQPPSNNHGWLNPGGGVKWRYSLGMGRGEARGRSNTVVVGGVCSLISQRGRSAPTKRHPRANARYDRQLALRAPCAQKTRGPRVMSASTGSHLLLSPAAPVARCAAGAISGAPRPCPLVQVQKRRWKPLPRTAPSGRKRCVSGPPSRAL